MKEIALPWRKASLEPKGLKECKWCVSSDWSDDQEETCKATSSSIGLEDRYTKLNCCLIKRLESILTSQCTILVLSRFPLIFYECQKTSATHCGGALISGIAFHTFPLYNLLCDSIRKIVCRYHDNCAYMFDCLAFSALCCILQLNLPWKQKGENYYTSLLSDKYCAHAVRRFRFFYGRLFSVLFRVNDLAFVASFLIRVTQS